jgi:hypothetical protein
MHASLNADADNSTLRVDDTVSSRHIRHKHSSSALYCQMHASHPNSAWHAGDPMG